MEQGMKEFGQNIWLWRAIIFSGFNNWFTVVGTSLCASNIASENHPLFSARTTAIILALVAGSKAIEAFMSQDLGRVKAQFADAFNSARIPIQVIPAPTPQPISVEPSKTIEEKPQTIETKTP